MLLQSFNPGQPVAVVVTVTEPNQSGLDADQERMTLLWRQIDVFHSPLIRRHGSEPNPRDLADDAIACGVPAWLFIIQRSEEGKKHQHEEERQKGVVDDVEDRDLH